jgi:hypothetical protein
MDETNVYAGPPVMTADGTRATVTDKRGRKITIRRVGPLLRTRLYKLMGAENSRNIPLLGEYQMAISVVAIDDEQIPFPTAESFISALLDRLDDDGLQAVAKGWRDNKWVDIEEGDPVSIKN